MMPTLVLISVLKAAVADEGKMMAKMKKEMELETSRLKHHFDKEKQRLVKYRCVSSLSLVYRG